MGFHLDIMKRKFKQWWSYILPISTKRTIISHLNWTHWTQKRPPHMILISSNFWFFLHYDTFLLKLTSTVPVIPRWTHSI